MVADPSSQPLIPSGIPRTVVEIQEEAAETERWSPHRGSSSVSPGDEVLKTDTVHSDSSESFSSGSTRNGERQERRSLNTPVNENHTSGTVQCPRSQKYPSSGSAGCREFWATTAPSGTARGVTKVRNAVLATDSGNLSPPPARRRDEFSTWSSDVEGLTENVKEVFICDPVHSTSPQYFARGLTTPEDHAAYSIARKRQKIANGFQYNVVNRSPTLPVVTSIVTGPNHADWPTILTTPSPPMDHAETYPYNCNVSPLFGNGGLKPHDHKVQSTAGKLSCPCGHCFPEMRSPRLAVSGRSQATPEHQLPTDFYLPELDPEEVDDVLDKRR